MAITTFRRSFHRALVFSFSAVLTVLLLEGLLRAMHASKSQVSSHKIERASDRSEKTFRIVAIGESTTAPDGSEDGRDASWPAILQDALQIELDRQGLGVRVEVINRGRTATSSGFLVESIERDIDELRPDLVISMMGVNDSILFSVHRGFFYRSSFLVRFIFWSLRFSDCPQCFKYSVERIDANAPQKIREMGNAEYRELVLLKGKLESWAIESLTEHQIVESVSSHLKNMSEMETESVKLHLAIYIFELINSSRSSTSAAVIKSREKYLLRACARMMEQSIPVVADYSASLEYYCNIQRQLGESCMDTVLLAIDRGVRPNSAVLNSLVLDPKSSNKRYRSMLSSYGWEIDPNRMPLEMTRASFKKLEALLSGNKIPWIAMQYPTGRPDGILAILDDEWNRSFPLGSKFRDFLYFQRQSPVQVRQSSDLFIVSNENFVKRNAQAEHPAYYFRDYFGRAHGFDFGHTTRNGGRLIVDNIIDQMRPHWREIVGSN